MEKAIFIILGLFALFSGIPAQTVFDFSLRHSFLTFDNILIVGFFQIMFRLVDPIPWILVI
jgi:hypothetical protein